MGSAAPIPHLLLVGARPEVVGKLLGLPLALTVVQQAGGSAVHDATVPLQVLSADITDSEALCSVIAQAHSTRPVDAILCLTEVALHAASLAGEALSVRVNPASCVELTLNKAAMRARLAERGLDTTENRICGTLGEAREFAERFPGGVILKPTDGNGGTGISLVRTPDQLAAAWAWTEQAADGGDILAERFLTGREISVESVSAAGRHRVLAVTAKHTTGPPHFVEIGHDIPAGLTDAQRRAAETAALQALNAVGHMWGPCHTELMLSDDQVSVVEINTRMGGDRIWELVELATGISLIGASAMALGYGRLPESAIRPEAASVRFLRAAPGRVVSVRGVDKALAMPDVLRVGDLPVPGDQIHQLTDYRDRAGHVIAASADPDQAQAAAEQAVACINIDTVAEGYTSRLGSPTVLRSAPR